MDYQDYLESMSVAQEFAGFDSVENILEWMQKHDLKGTSIDFVSHDEFNYSFLIQLETVGRWLVCGAN